MSNRKAKMDPADLAAAKRLLAIWNEKLAEARDSRSPFTQESAGEAMGGMTQGAVSQYLGAKIPLGYGATLKFAKFLGVPPTEIRADLDALPRESAEESWEDVTGYAQAAGLGDGIEAQEYAETHKLKFRAESLRRKRLNPSTLAVVYGRGESMLPRIHSGDAILFDQSDTTPADEALFVILAPGVNAGEYSVKRCRLFGEDVYFDALNPQGDHQWRKPRKMSDSKAPIAIIGRVRWIGSWED